MNRFSGTGRRVFRQSGLAILLFGGIAGVAEVAAEVAERCIWSLEAPVQRITGYDTPMPLFKLEHDYMPSVARIVAGIRNTLEV